MYLVSLGWEEIRHDFGDNIELILSTNLSNFDYSEVNKKQKMRFRNFNLRTYNKMHIV